jgi:YidC/Oxa1 family membrane protein insertase
MDNKRVLLAFLLSFAVLIAFRWAFPPAVEQPAPPATPPASATAVPQPDVKPPAIAPKAPAAGVPVPQDLHADQAEGTVIENSLYKATVYNEGGVLKSFQLIKAPYFDATGHPLELINGVSASSVGWPLSIATGDPKLDAFLSHAVFVVHRDGDKLSLEFAGEGIHALKTMEFDSSNYQFTITTLLERDGQAVPHQIVWQAGFGDQSVPDEPKKKNAVYDADSKFTRVVLSGIKAPVDVTTSLIGAEDQYFISMLVLPQPAPVKISETDFNAADNTPSKALRIAVPGAETVHIYVGPKEEARLQQADPRLGAILNYGFFGFISKPVILPVLKWIHGYVGNYGWAIVLITILVNFVLFPLRLKSQISMQKMQKIQPQVNTLQDKYKKMKANDPRRAEVQAEIMKLYQEHGSPIGGCLPLLLQMPVMLSFYSMLSVSIELRQAPWILWIHDLSRPDPYYIIPIFMAIAMVIGQKMTPTTVDPAQAKMMLIMPVVMTVFFLWVQSGLTLYWLTSNLVGIGQQWFIRKYWSGDTDGKVKLVKASQGTSR